MPSYKHIKYLEKRLKSILSQTYVPYEIIFLDDHSQDGSPALAEQILLASNIPYKIIVNTTNQGIVKQWLKGFEIARGDLVWIAETDDVCEPGLLEELVKGFKRDPRVVLSYCQSKRINENDEVLRDTYLDYTHAVNEDKWLTSYIREGHDEIKDTLSILNSIPNASAVLMKRLDLSKIAMDLTSFKTAIDWMMYLFILEYGKIHYSPKVLNHHRLHSSSALVTNGPQLLMREIIMIQDRVAKKYLLNAEIRHKASVFRKTAAEHLGIDLTSEA